MAEILRREFVYLWYYFDLQFRQIFGYWVLGIFAASALGIASPLCRYGTIPLAASFSESGMEDDWLAALRLLEKTYRGRIDLIYIDIIAEFDTKPRKN